MIGRFAACATDRGGGVMTAGASRRLVVVLSGLALAVALVIGLPAAAAALSRPVVTSVSPAKGAALGGTLVTVRGHNFKASGRNLVRAVRFGTRAATKVHVVSATKLTCRAPRGVGVVNVRVVTTAGTSSVRKADRFAYQGGPPVVQSVSPAYGPAGGGTVVTIGGSGFTGATAVTFGLGGKAAKSFTVVSDNSITATAPGQNPALDPYHVVVRTPLGASRASTADVFNYYAAPTVTSVSPANGAQTGGTVVTIHGTNLLTAKNVSGPVLFGGVQATGVSVRSNTTITATAPAGTGTVDVTVTTWGGSSVTAPADEFSYAATVAANGASGQTQTAAAGMPVGTPPSVLVTDGTGAPVPNLLVSFTVATGGGSATGTSATTDASGVATVGSWTLGTGLGDNTMTATCAGVPGASVTFHATAVPGTGVDLAANAGDGQHATAGSAVATPPSVIVTDNHGNPVSGIEITFSVASGDGSVTGATATTDDTGVATVGSWTLGPTVGNNTLTATGTGLTPPSVTFTATGTVGAAAKISAEPGGDGQTAIVGTAVSTPPSVRVTDAHDNPVRGVSVTFAAASGGGSVTGGSTTTDASGVATVGSWTMGAAPVVNTLTATSGTLEGSPVTFSATATVGPPAGVAVHAGDGQTATAGTDVAIVPTVLVTDGQGNPLSGVTVSFSASGDGQVGNDTAQTNASGIAGAGSWTLATSAGANTLTATVGTLQATFTATGTAGGAAHILVHAGDGQTATAGTDVAVAPTVLVTDVHGNPVAGVSVSFTPSGNGIVGNDTAQTNASGIAGAGSWTLATSAGANTLTATAGSLQATFDATGAAGPARNIVAEAGDGQTATVGAAVAIAPTVRVTDAHGNPVSGVIVSFAGDGSTGNASDATDASGIASAGSWTLSTTAGPDTLTATATGLSGSPVTFGATGTAGPATTVSPAGGDGQTAPAGTEVAVAPSVSVTDQYGNAVSGVSVSFAASGDGVVGNDTDLTDAAGIASCGSWTLDSTPGDDTLTATVDGLAGSPVTFSATGTAS